MYVPNKISYLALRMRMRDLNPIMAGRFISQQEQKRQQMMMNNTPAIPIVINTKLVRRQVDDQTDTENLSMRKHC